MMSFKKIIAIGMVAATALTSSAVSMATAPVAKVFADTTPVETATYNNGELIFGENLKGNYITVAQYVKSDGAKQKTAFVITDETEFFSLASFNLKKETYWKVYDETMTEADAKLITVPAQSDKVTIKIADTTKKDVIGLLSIKVGKSDLTDKSKLGDITVVDSYGNEVVELDSEDAVDNIKKLAVRGGATLSVTYVASDKSIAAPVSAATKFKVPAAAKAPKVTVDYVNGTYKLPNKSEYFILTVDEDGVIASVSGTAVAVDSKAAQTLTIDKVFEDKAVKESGATQAAIYVQVAASGKKFASQPAVLKVAELDTATCAGTVAMSGSAVEVKDAKVTVGKDTIAEIVKNTAAKAKDGEVVIKASKDIAYSTDGGNKWVTVKAGKDSKVITVKANDTISIKLVGDKKNAQFGSGEAKIVVK